MIPELSVHPDDYKTLVAEGVVNVADIDAAVVAAAAAAAVVPDEPAVDVEAAANRRMLAEGADAFKKADRTGAFAVYTRATDTSAATLDVPALKLKLTLKKFKGTGVTHVEEVSDTEYIREG